MPRLIRALVFSVWSVVLVIGSGCGEGRPLQACADVSWYPRNPHMTAPPGFSASQVAPGDPLSVTIPVNAEASSASVGIRLADDPDWDPRGGITAQGPTLGNDRLRLPILTDDLAPRRLYCRERVGVTRNLSCGSIRCAVGAAPERSRRREPVHRRILHDRRGPAGRLQNRPQRALLRGGERAHLRASFEGRACRGSPRWSQIGYRTSITDR